VSVETPPPSYMHACTHAYIERERLVVPKGFEAESFPLKYNLTRSECKIHSVEAYLHYFK